MRWCLFLLATGLVGCGGFSYGDVLGAGGGWAKTILHNAALAEMFAAFFARVAAIDGVTVYIAGAGGQAADSSEVFEGIDSTLLFATLSVVVVILLFTYRSPSLWLLPIMCAGVSLTVARIDEEGFDVSLIPETLERTTLGAALLVFFVVPDVWISRRALSSWPSALRSCGFALAGALVTSAAARSAIVRFPVHPRPSQYVPARPAAPPVMAGRADSNDDASRALARIGNALSSPVRLELLDYLVSVDEATATVISSDDTATTSTWTRTGRP